MILKNIQEKIAKTFPLKEKPVKIRTGKIEARLIFLASKFCLAIKKQTVVLQIFSLIGKLIKNLH